MTLQKYIPPDQRHLTYIKKSNQLFATDAADGLGRHAQHGSNILERYLVEDLAAVFKQHIITLLSGHGQEGKHAFFQRYKAMRDEQFLGLVPFWNKIPYPIIISLVDGV